MGPVLILRSIIVVTKFYPAPSSKKIHLRLQLNDSVETADVQVHGVVLNGLNSILRIVLPTLPSKNAYIIRYDDYPTARHQYQHHVSKKIALMMLGFRIRFEHNDCSCLLFVVFVCLIRKI